MPKNNTMKTLKFIGFTGLIVLAGLLVNYGYFKAENDTMKVQVQDNKDDIEACKKNNNKVLQEVAKQTVEIENLKKDVAEIKEEFKEGNKQILDAIKDLKNDGHGESDSSGP